jgi:hypothetical protein
MYKTLNNHHNRSNAWDREECDPLSGHQLDHPLPGFLSASDEDISSDQENNPHDRNYALLFVSPDVNNSNVDEYKELIRLFKALRTIATYQIKTRIRNDWAHYWKSARWNAPFLDQNLSKISSLIAHKGICQPSLSSLEKLNLSPKVRDYVRRFEIETDIIAAHELIEKNTPSGSLVGFTIEGDCESDELWLIANLSIKAPESEVFQIFDKFVDIWISSLPKKLRQRTRLTYSVR